MDMFCFICTYMLYISYILALEPTIECPHDVTISLPRNQNTVQLGESYRGPTTNMEPSHVTSSPANVSSSYSFSLGTNYVKMIVTNDIGHRAECSYIVTVKGYFLFSLRQLSRVRDFKFTYYNLTIPSVN